MKLPQVSLRELFLLVVIAALALGWFVNWERYHSAYLNSLNDAMRAKHHVEQLKGAIQGEGYAAEYDETTRGYTLTTFEDMTRAERSAWYFRTNDRPLAE